MRRTTAGSPASSRLRYAIENDDDQVAPSRPGAAISSSRVGSSNTPHRSSNQNMPPSFSTSRGDGQTKRVHAEWSPSDDDRARPGRTFMRAGVRSNDVSPSNERERHRQREAPPVASHVADVSSLRSKGAWWVANLVSKDRFEATAPSHFSCCLCEDPALPFTVIAPCGHVLCKLCADGSTRCPDCESRVESRTVVSQLSGCVMASLTFECKTRRCTFSTMDPHEAFRHTCAANDTIAGQQQQQPPPPPHRSASSASTANPLFVDTADQANAEQCAPMDPRRTSHGGRSASSNPLDHLAWSSSSMGQTNGLHHPSTTLLRTRQRKTMIFWDLESMQPSFYGLAPRLFFRKLLGCLVASCGVSSEVQSLVYCPDDLDPFISASLVELGAFTRIYPVSGSGGKEGMETAAVACVSVDMRQLIQSVLDEAMSLHHHHQPVAQGGLESDTMYDVVVVSAAARFILGCRKLLCEVAQVQPRSPFFMHVVSDMTALPMSQKMEIQRGAITYVDASDFTPKTQS